MNFFAFRDETYLRFWRAVCLYSAYFVLHSCSDLYLFVWGAVGGDCSVLAACICHPGQYANVVNLARSCGLAGNSACPANQSSNYFVPTQSMEASTANDGLFPPQNTEFASTNKQADPWWMVDFGSPLAVGSITVYNRVDCCQSRLDGFQIWIGNNSIFDGVGNAMCYSSTAADDMDHDNAPYIQSFACVGEGRYAFVTLPGSQILSLSEIQIFPPCQICIAGTYSNKPEEHCSNCPAGSYSDSGFSHTDIIPTSTRFSCLRYVQSLMRLSILFDSIQIVKIYFKDT